MTEETLNETVTLTMPRGAALIILNALAEKPFKQVAALIADLGKQIEPVRTTMPGLPEAPLATEEG